jgi:hypothetical protein
MSNVLIISSIPLLENEEINALAEEDVQVTVMSTSDEGLRENAGVDLDYIILKNGVGGAEIYQVSHVGKVKKPAEGLSACPREAPVGAR